MKLGAVLTVTAMVGVCVTEPEVPLIVTVVGPPVAAVAVEVRVSTLVPVVEGFGLKEAVTPAGSPLAERVTPPVKPVPALTVILSVLLLPCTIKTALAAGDRVNVGAALTVSDTVVDAVLLPEVPLMVTVTGPLIVAVAAAVSVSTLVLVVGLVAKVAVTPLGKPLAESVTPPANPP